MRPCGNLFEPLLGFLPTNDYSTTFCNIDTLMIDEQQQDTDTNRNDDGTFNGTRVPHRIDKTFNDSVLLLT